MESLQKLFARNARGIRDMRDLTEGDLVSLGVPAGSAHRGLTDAGQNLKLETLQKWAKALKTPAWALLHPDFNPDNPLVVTTAAEIEAEVEKRVREKIKPISALIGGLSDTEEPRPDGRSANKPFPDLPPAAAVPPAAKVPSERKRKAKGRRDA